VGLFIIKGADADGTAAGTNVAVSVIVLQKYNFFLE
jgi:hypothetical protein